MNATNLNNVHKKAFDAAKDAARADRKHAVIVREMIELYHGNIGEAKSDHYDFIRSRIESARAGAEKDAAERAYSRARKAFQREAGKAREAAATAGKEAAEKAIEGTGDTEAASAACIDAVEKRLGKTGMTPEAILEVANKATAAAQAPGDDTPERKAYDTSKSGLQHAADTLNAELSRRKPSEGSRAALQALDTILAYLDLDRPTA